MKQGRATGSQVALNLNGHSLEPKILDVDLAEGIDVEVRIQYDEEVLRVFVGEGSNSPVISDSRDLKIYLPQKVYVGFSASTGNNTQLNCVRSWTFSALDLDEDHQKWIWIIVAAIIALFIGLAFSLCWKWKYYVGKGDDTGFELQIQGSSTGRKPSNITIFQIWYCPNDKSDRDVENKKN